MVQAVAAPAAHREHITMKSLLEAGVHFGHQTRRWNPNMKRYIFMHRNGIHIIDLQQTLVMLESAARAISQIVANGGEVLFVGTKKQAQESIQNEATRCGMPYVNQRWLGGTLTNFQTIQSRVKYMLELEEKKEKGHQATLTKKESLKMDEQMAKLQKYFTGIRDMKKLPAALFIVDLEKEDICVAEVRRLGIPVAAVVDTNCDPSLVTMPVPGNDDAIRSIRLMSSRMADAVLDGLQRRAEIAAEAEEAAREDEYEEEAMSDGSEPTTGELSTRTDIDPSGADDSVYYTATQITDSTEPEPDAEEPPSAGKEGDEEDPSEAMDRPL